MSEMWKQGRNPLQGFASCDWDWIPTAAALYERINQRAQHMFDAGLVEETLDSADEIWRGSASAVRSRLQTGRGPDAGRVRAVTRAVQAAQQAHRNYAKRQMTWFRREPDVIWICGFGDDARVQSEAIRKIEDMQQTSLARVESAVPFANFAVKDFGFLKPNRQRTQNL